MTAASESRFSRTLLIVVLILTAASALAWGHYRPLDQDEWFVFQTDTVSSISKLVEVQRHYPISLDPLFYHLLGHASTSLFGATAFAIRLPSLLGFLLMQVCLYFVAKRIAGNFAGFIAAIIPALTATLFYAQQARPYGVLLGLGALLLLAYQHGTRDPQRTGWLIALAASLALALNTHYFAILLLLPLYTAELVRIVQRRRIDWPMFFAIAIGSAGALLTLPFQKGAGEFRKHYYNVGKIGLHAVTQSYRALFLNYTQYSLRAQHILIVLLVVAALVLVGAILVRFRANDPTVPLAEKAFLLVLAILPFFGFLLARFVTHSIEVRYILPAILGLSVLIAIAITPIERNAFRARALVGIVLLLLVGAGFSRAANARLQRPSLQMLTIAHAAALSGPIYIQNMGHFDELGNAIADPAVRSRIALVYSAPLEIALAHHDTQSLTAEHMQHFTGYRIEQYEDLRSQPGPHLMIVYPGSGWDWLDSALEQDHATITPLGLALGGEFVSVAFSAKENR
ncbi:glycosyltransferase family 39 protein [Terriglobus roseus]|uniref:Dolichyl-phosphate-mannose-protein mannosyltransferase n=1 Tax=Terriglobus roseus TaxID=392734 RepID=A0A1G7Q7G5_9BACT|nr:glycosyltransferase family 39 protein [Terriglobus roseus]SDF94456.1 Dolichyl-phosphate-mannose-protein mannosyltransferase [Terriglobus roseus]